MTKESIIPSLTTIFHANDDQLAEYYPQYLTNHSVKGQDFNSIYAAESSELDLDYDRENAELSFSPLIEKIKQHLGLLENQTLLEIGGSTGILAKNLQDQGAKITLLETQEKFVNKAKERGVVDARIYNGTNLTNVLAGKKYKAIIAHRVFEDIVMPEEQTRIIMNQARTLLEPGGLIIIGTQNSAAVWKTAITRGSGLQLFDSQQFPNHGYVRQVNVYK